MSFFEIFQPRWRHSDPAVRLGAVADMIGDDRLGEIAMSDPAVDVRLAAAGRVKGEETLVWLAENARCARVRELAVAGVGDDVVLRRIGGSDTDARVRHAAWLRSDLSSLVRRFVAEEMAKLPLLARSTIVPVVHRGSRGAVIDGILADRRLAVNGVPYSGPGTDQLILLAAQRSVGGEPTEAGVAFCQIPVERLGKDLFVAGFRECRKGVGAQAPTRG